MPSARGAGTPPHGQGPAADARLIGAVTGAGSVTRLLASVPSARAGGRDAGAARVGSSPPLRGGGFLARAASWSGAPGGLPPSVPAGLGPARPGECDVCGVFVPWGCGSACGAGVGALTRRQCMLGSRHAVRAVHRGVRGVHEADVPPVFAVRLDRSGLGGADGGAGGLRAMVVLVRNVGRKSSTAMASWSRTVFLARLRAVSARCLVAFLASFVRAFLPCPACGRSCASEVVVAVSFTPQSTPT